MSKSKQETRAEQIAVSDDQAQCNPDLWIVPGAWVQIQCADPIYYGQLVAMTPSHYYLRDASWICETGRANEFVLDPQKACTEAEYLGDVAVERPVVCVIRTRKGGPVGTR